MSRFVRLEHKLEKEKHLSPKRAKKLAAYIGIKKYGAKKISRNGGGWPSQEKG